MSILTFRQNLFNTINQIFDFYIAYETSTRIDIKRGSVTEPLFIGFQ